MIPYNLFQKVEEKGILPNLLYEASSIHILKVEKKKKGKKKAEKDRTKKEMVLLSVGMWKSAINKKNYTSSTRVIYCREQKLVEYLTIDQGNWLY